MAPAGRCLDSVAMKAIVQHAYGPAEALRLEEMEKPVVGDGDVLLRVQAAGVNALDWHFVRGIPYMPA